MFNGKKETWLVVVEEKSRLLLRKQKVFQHKYSKSFSTQILQTGQSGSVLLSQKKEKKNKTAKKEFQSLDCNLKRGLKALKTLSFICSGQWKVENRVLVMFSLERRNFNGQFFTFLRGAKISSEDFNTPKNIEVTDNDDVDNDDGDDDDYNDDDGDDDGNSDRV